jgi:PKHD-type hydroxylase
MRIEPAQDEAARVIFPIALPAAGRTGTSPPQVLPTRGRTIGPMVFNRVFSPAECASIIRYGARFKLRRGRMTDARPDCRRSDIAWLNPCDETTWLYERVADTFRAVNHWYKFKLVGFVEPLQFTVYHAGDGFSWHFDTGPGPGSTRKLSMTIQLTDGDDYQGGSLEFCATDPLRFSRELGTIIVFPSFLPHRVLTVTRGIRHALVAWGHGPAFR